MSRSYCGLASGLRFGKDPVGTRGVTSVTPPSLLKIILMLRFCFPEMAVAVS
jgi:hypothetical protein